MTYSSYALISAACLITAFVLSQVVSYIENYRFAKAHGCKPAKQFPQPERILGYKHFKEQVDLARTKRILPAGVTRFREFGNTFSIVTMGKKLLITIEPENVKEILATNFKDFGIGQRVNALGALLGQGIFTSDGQLWEHSRVRSKVFS